MLDKSDSAQNYRSRWIHQGLQLEWLTIGWMIVEAGVAIVAGLIAHSLTLEAFGADSIIELFSACVLLWRLDIEVRRGQDFSERAETVASKIAGGLLFALAVYVIVAALLSFWHRSGAEVSIPGLIVALVAIPVMLWLSRSKLHVAAQIGSRALRADAIEAVTCAWLSVVVVISVVAQMLFHTWWVDGATSLAIVYFLIREGREAWVGDDCCDDD